MATTKEIMDGMDILSKYTQNNYAIGAEHDVLYFYVDHDGPSREDQARLEQLGWVRDDGGSWAVNL